MKNKSGILSDIKATNESIKNDWAKLWLGAIIVMAFLALSLLIPVAGFGVCLLVFSYLGAGYLNYVNKIINNENAKLLDIFNFSSGLLTIIKLLTTLFVSGLIILFYDTSGSVIFYVLTIYLLILSFIFIIEVKYKNQSLFDSFNNFIKTTRPRVFEYVLYKLIILAIYLIILLVIIITYSGLSKVLFDSRLLTFSISILIFTIFYLVIAYFICFTFSYGLIKYNSFEEKVSNPIKNKITNDNTLKDNDIRPNDNNKDHVKKEIVDKSSDESKKS